MNKKIKDKLIDFFEGNYFALNKDKLTEKELKFITTYFSCGSLSAYKSKSILLDYNNEEFVYYSIDVDYPDDYSIFRKILNSPFKNKLK